ncbi:right-handed parallel beta-helix repeat-containing protein [Sphingomonas aracearum]|uniref:Right-handed parallel beta-helix repeat-containing protein n=1 Tax=Sphingomonas aracearum TaxID=2283317 RepID=A0A369VVY0_9SPHN|nr:right-handed parallel beta-helix repeat-containing protein [Sphingomonas aracearum]RDE06498.1 right-handed parallel beta-helix repeat-containing protein [Sphingomonas aracearum]
MRYLAPLLLAAPMLLGTAAAPAPDAPFTIAETGQGFGTLDEAVQSVRMGRATILIAPGVYHQCTVQAGGVITFKAREPGTAIFEGTACEGKAAFVLRGQGSTVDGLVFRGFRVSDGNGAGIRTEMGDLTVTHSMFLDSQEGILGGEPVGQRITIDHSTFAGLGQCDEAPNCSHSIYLANKGEVVVTNSRFERGTGGHYVKIRSPRVTISDNSFDDSKGSKTNYMIDLPEGGTGTITRNVFQNGRNKENWTAFIAIAAEAKTYPATGLTIAGNTANQASGVSRTPAFVADYTHQRIALDGNKLGAGIRPFELR